MNKWLLVPGSIFPRNRHRSGILRPFFCWVGREAPTQQKNSLLRRRKSEEEEEEEE
jgi:hypothetical protein